MHKHFLRFLQLLGHITETLHMSDVLHSRCIFPNIMLYSGLGIHIQSDSAAVLGGC